jgi:phosphoglycolate phosphatase-like HAD superfamily hydrolase
MARLSLNGRLFDVDLIAFDKDGTLIDFHHLWGRKAQLWVTWLQQRVDGPASLGTTLYRSLGYNPETGRVISDGPLAVASMGKLYTIAAAVLYQQGFGWHEAEQIVAESVAASVGTLPTPDLVRPIGDVTGTISRLAAAGVRLAVITSDDRAATQTTLLTLGVADKIDVLVCGDDAVPNKPAPDALWHAGRQLNVDPTRMMMVGDTASDMLCGLNAGVGCRLGILSGAGDEATLAGCADITLASIDEIRIT